MRFGVNSVKRIANMYKIRRKSRVDFIKRESQLATEINEKLT